MKLEDLRKLAEARTKGENGIWDAEDNGSPNDSWDISLHDDYLIIADEMRADNAKFIAAFANHADALLDVVEAAKEAIDNQRMGDANIERLEDAIAKLEATR